MGSYGIGPGRLMGTVVEALADDKGIIWPESIAPFQLHLLSLGDDENVTKEASDVYEKLLKNGCLLYTSPSPRDGLLSRMPSSA